MRRAKIVCTIGPASDTVDTLTNMLNAGMNIARLNFSHGTHDEHYDRLNRIREACRTTGRPIGVLQDLCGPKIRAGKMQPGGVTLVPGKRIDVITDPDHIGNESVISTQYDHLAKDVKPGDRIMLDDGTMTLQVDSVDVGTDTVTCHVVTGGTLLSNKGINLPGVSVSSPSVTDKDMADLEWGLKHVVDYVALSFVRSPDDILKVRKACESVSRPPHIIAKIERPEALEHLDAIVDAADALMVARGDLGVEMDAEEVPLLQKRIIRTAHGKDKPVITATQMLDSMTRNPRPTRAEVSDVANAILDYSDAVMLSGETAAGKYPVESVGTMARIVTRMERYMVNQNMMRMHTRDYDVNGIMDAICLGAGSIADDLDLNVIVSASHTGATTRYLSMARPAARIVGLTSDSDIIGRMCLYWGVSPVWVSADFRNRDELVSAVEEALEKAQIDMKPGELVAVTYGVPFGERVPTNTIMVHRIPDA